MRVLQQKLESQEPETPLEVSLFYYMWRVIDWYRFFRTDTDYLYVYVPDMQNRYLFTVIKSILHFGFSSFQSS